MARPAEAAHKPVERFFQFAVLGLLSSGYLAVAGSGVLDLPTVTLAALSLVLRGLLVTGAVKIHISERAITAATIAYIGFYPLDYTYISQDFLTATVHLIFFLAITKVITARTHRDYFFLKVVAFLELLAASVLSSSLSYFFFLGLFLLFAVATFSSSEIHRAAERNTIVVRAGLQGFPRRLTALTAVITTGILILTGGLFFLLPRTAQAAFRRFMPQRYHMAGFSSEITLGQMGEVRKDNAPVMHVRMEMGDPPQNLKWRGIALGHFDGIHWANVMKPDEILRIENSRLRLVDYRQWSRPGRRIGYEVHLKPMDSETLFFAGVPEVVSINLPRVIRTALDGYRTNSGLDGLQYAVSSFLPMPGARFRDPFLQPLSPELRTAFLELPQVDPRIPALAREVTATATDDFERGQMLELFLHRNYGYTTDLLSAPVADPLAHFVFVRRKGHCEYFASAMAVMLRSLNIPSRVITGFQSGVYNPITGMQVVRMSDAHSWVEAWIPRQGWTTFDPTPPDRSGAQSSLSASLALYMDAADTFWQDWVLNYDLEHQLTLASTVRSSKSWNWNWLDLASPGSALKGFLGRGLTQHGRAAAAVIFCAAILVIGAPRLLKNLLARRRVFHVKRGSVTASDATLLYNRMLMTLKRRGLEKPPWLTPVEFAHVVPQSSISALVDGITAAYNDLRFGGRSAAGPRMLHLIEQLEAIREP